MMPTKQSLFALTMLTLLSGTAIAQEQPEFPGPTKEHQWLKKFVGEWSMTSKATMGPDQQPIECSGTMQARMIGEFWVVNEMKSTSQGMTGKGLQTIGYDPDKKKYVGTWVDSMTNHIWIYEGTVDETGKKITLEAVGPNIFADGKLNKFRDSYEFQSPDVMIVTSSMLNDDGKWVPFMTGTSRRKKPEDK
ncbi:DUF1579 domain-containing protein [Thalassoroseus pseudoceratinae]|uniref:DUF1579 domain-containing protein n=1 Tax=Thalassoroseus pseudoceratinae TaxID=2713176 RepID=UPI00197D7A17|nr:DUF1579 domain-containing protein [Thalassoroseus pseudoceratinae]